MRFNGLVHWSDGLLLQPHHMQEMQRSLMNMRRAERNIYLPYSSGIADFEIDTEALGARRVVVKRLSAIMNDGQEISMPGNAVIPPLTLNVSQDIKNDVVTVYLAVPYWSAHESNLNEDGGTRRLYSIKEVTIKDENSGDNEIVILKRIINARLVSDLSKASDCTVIPVLKLICISRNAAEPRFVLSDYMPPFLFVTKDCPLMEHISELIFQLKRRKDKILGDLGETGYNPEEPSPSNIYAVLQLRSINAYEARLNSLISTEKATPFILYMELRSLLGELAALQPLSKRDQVPNYDHMDAMPAFKEIITNIRSLIMAEGYAGYSRHQFLSAGDETFYRTVLKEEDMAGTKDFYIAVICMDEPGETAKAVEFGDTFKLINPKARNERIRGVKLREMRYPPRFLPVISNAVWFKIITEDSARIWNDIRLEHAMAIDIAPGKFKGFKAWLFITSMEGGKSE